MGFLVLPMALVGLFEWIVLLVGQALVLLLSEDRPKRTRVLRSLAYWGLVAGLLALASPLPVVQRWVLLPMLIWAMIPIYAGEALTAPFRG